MDNKLATEMLQNFKETKYAHGAIIAGLPGCGKDALVEKIFPETERVKKTGYITGRGLFEALSDNKSKTIVLSDTYGWESDEGMSILKAAVDTRPKRVVTRDTKDKLEPITFNGKIIFVVNALKATRHLDALKSRCEYIHLELSEEGFVKTASDIIRKEFKNTRYLSPFIEFMIQNNCLDLRKVTSYYDKILQYHKNHTKLTPEKFEKKWQTMLYDLIREHNGDNEVGFIMEQQSKKLTTAECKALFTQKFACSDRTFFRRWAETKVANYIN